jgi:hypothetical protein
MPAGSPGGSVLAMRMVVQRAGRRSGGYIVSAADLFAWKVGHGIRLETRSGMYEILVDSRSKAVVRLVNSMLVEEWPEHSLTAQQLDGLFDKFFGALHELNAARDDAGRTADPSAYHRLYRKINSAIKGE